MFPWLLLVHAMSPLTSQQAQPSAPGVPPDDDMPNAIVRENQLGVSIPEIVKPPWLHAAIELAVEHASSSQDFEGIKTKLAEFEGEIETIREDMKTVKEDIKMTKEDLKTMKAEVQEGVAALGKELGKTRRLTALVCAFSFVIMLRADHVHALRCGTAPEE